MTRELYRVVKCESDTQARRSQTNVTVTDRVFMRVFFSI